MWKPKMTMFSAVFLLSNNSILRFFYEENSHGHITENIWDEIEDAKLEEKTSVYLGDKNIKEMYINGQELKEPLEWIYTHRIVGWRIGIKPAQPNFYSVKEINKSLGNQ